MVWHSNSRAKVDQSAPVFTATIIRRDYVHADLRHFMLFRNFRQMKSLFLVRNNFLNGPACVGYGIQ